MVTVAYITEGYEKYEFETHIVGIYSGNTANIFRDLYRKLMELHHVEDELSIHDLMKARKQELDAEIQKNSKYCGDTYAGYSKSLVLQRKIYEGEMDQLTEEEFHDAICSFGDSYEDQGWSWTIEGREITE